MTTAPKFHRTRRGQWLVLAPVGNYTIGDRITVPRNDRTRATVTIAHISRPFRHGNGQAVYLTPARIGYDPTGTCDGCGITTTDELYRTADANNIAGAICRDCQRVPVDLLTFVPGPAPQPQLR